MPNGFVLSGERGPSLVQRDSVRDVAPSPDWGRVVYGRAWGAQERERDSLPAAEWADLARQVGLSADVVRGGAFVMRSAVGGGRVPQDAITARASRRPPTADRPSGDPGRVATVYRAVPRVPPHPSQGRRCSVAFHSSRPRRASWPSC